jgi:surface antigen
MKRWWLATGLALGVGVSAVGAVASPAQADHGISTTAAVTIRAIPSGSSAGYGTVPKGTSPTYLCWTRGSSVGGLTVWFLINYRGHTGFIPSYYDNSHYSSASDIPSKYGIPTCSTSGHGISTTAAVTMRGTPHNVDANQGSVPKGISPTYRCWARGDSVGGLTVWFLATYSGHTGFIPSHYDNSSYSSASDIPSKYHIPSCGSTGTTPTSISAFNTTSSTGGYPFTSAKCTDQTYVYNGVQYCQGDNWAYNGSLWDAKYGGYGYRNCTDWVAYRVATHNGRPVPKGMHDASNWGPYFKAHGYTPNSTPKVGSIAWESGGNHVAYVEVVYSNGTVKISEYNEHYRPGYPTWGNGQYDTRTVSSGTFKYIHWKDLG